MKIIWVFGVITALVIGVGIYLHGSVRVPGTNPVVDRQITGIILPHHDLAAGLIVSAINQLQTIRPDLRYLVVLSPNHWGGRDGIFYTTSIWEEFPLASAEIARLRQNYPQLADNPELLAGEHGLSVPMTYLLAAYPDVLFIPIAVPVDFRQNQVIEFSRVLGQTLPADTLYIASTDFSHGHTYEEALVNDRETIGVLQTADWAALLKFGDDNLDCPVCAAVLLLQTNNHNHRGFDVWQESHGAEITGNAFDTGTSYLTGAFWTKP